MQSNVWEEGGSYDSSNNVKCYVMMSCYDIAEGLDMRWNIFPENVQSMLFFVSKNIYTFTFIAIGRPLYLERITGVLSKSVLIDVSNLY